METTDTREKELALNLAGINDEKRDLAWKKLLHQYGDVMYRIAFRFSQNDEDIASDIFLFTIEALSKSCLDKKPPIGYVKFQRYIDSLEQYPDSTFKTWLTQVCYNLCKDWHRANYGRRSVPSSVLKLGEAAVELFKEIYWYNSGEQSALFKLVEKQLIKDNNEFDTTLLLIEHSLGDVQRWSAISGGLRRTSPTSIDTGGFRSEDGETSNMEIADSYFDPVRDAEKHQAGKQIEQVYDLMREIVEMKSPQNKQAIGLWCEGRLKAKEIAELLELDSAKSVYKEVEKFKAKLEKAVIEKGINWDCLAPNVRLLNGSLEKIIFNSGKKQIESV